ncbi:hypothetical protein [Methanobrevibacter sp.]
MLTGFSKYLREDVEKKKMIDSLLDSPKVLCIKNLQRPEKFDFMEEMSMADFSEIERMPTKFCPKCHRKYYGDENFCFDCLVALKPMRDKVAIEDIKTKPVFTFNGKNSYKDLNEILTPENLELINRFDLSVGAYNRIIRNIKKTALENMDRLIKDNYVDLNDINVFEHVLLFTKSFVKVGYKSYGQELGYFEFDKIIIDERQTETLLITTLIHELSHFILKEILTEILCKLLDCNKNIHMECLVDYILISSNFTRLIDEYSAHCCEGRFTVYGYQDYSSFLNIIASMDGEMDRDEIEITKSIGNTFANSIKDILESVIDRELLNRIKRDFERYHIEQPNYEMLKLENCEILTCEGFLKSIWLILSEGFENSLANREKIIKYYNGVI